MESETPFMREMRLMDEAIGACHSMLSVMLIDATSCPQCTWAASARDLHARLLGNIPAARVRAERAIRDGITHAPVIVSR